MKALGLWQPYAGLIRLGIKTIETRFWSTKYRGSILICSTAKVVHEQVITNLLMAGYEFDVMNVASTSSMECIVDLVDCRLGTMTDELAACCNLFDVNPKTGKLQQKYAFILENPRHVTPERIKCGRRWFNVADDEIEVIS
jgi:hypothetical protein